MDEVHLGPEATVLAGRIREIDRDVDSLDERVRESVIRGLGNSGAAMAANANQTASDKKRAGLLEKRAELVRQLKELVATSRDGTRDLGVL